MVIFDKMKEHVKHPPLVRRTGGQFHAHEWSLHGSPCGPMADWAAQLMAELNEQSGLKGTWVDASHHPETPSLFSKITQQSESWQGQFPLHQSPFALRSLLSGSAYVLLNGNHFTAERQLVLLDPAKRASLERKLDQLKEVIAFITTPEQREVWPFLKAIPNYDLIPILPQEGIQAIAGLLLKDLESVPVLKGLVLAGGQSMRMGEDKGRISYHGIPQRTHVANLLKPFCQEVYLSGRPGQYGDGEPDFPILEDCFTGLGPLGAILSAFRHDPNAAWLVVACDLPLLEAPTIQALVHSRRPPFKATAFRTHPESFPEPMLAIWEPSAYPELLQQLAHGWSCPRKYLIRAHCNILDAPDPAALANANTPEERDKALAQIRASRQEI